MCASLIQSMLVKQTRNYDYTPDFHSSVGVTVLESGQLKLI